MVFQRKETPTPDFSARRELKVVRSGIPSAFQHEVVGARHSGDKSEPIWYSVVDLSVHLGLPEVFLLCPLPSVFCFVWRLVVPDLNLLNTFAAEDKHESPVLGIRPLSFPNILSPRFSVKKLTFLPGAT